MMGRAQTFKNGKLKKQYRPAVYLDSSVVIDYWLVEGLGYPSHLETKEQEHCRIIRELLNADKRLKRVIGIREKLEQEPCKTTPIVSPLCILELMEWYTEDSFKELASDVCNIRYLQKQGKKAIGDYLRQLFELHLAEIEHHNLHGGQRTGSTGLEIIMSETWLNQSFTECNGLNGLFYADMSNFSFCYEDAWKSHSIYAYMQLGAADIMHILCAKHLGCQYMASFDEDFKRVKDVVNEEMGIQILFGPDELLEIL